MAHENLLPALERFSVLISRLRGLSKFHVSKVTLGLSTQELDNILDTTNCLQLVAHEILIAAGSELRQFRAFSGWLRQEIENQASDTSPSDTTEKDINVDHASTLSYIRGPMIQSQLIRLFNFEKRADQSGQWDLAAEGRSLFELYKRELTGTAREDSPVKRIPGLDTLIDHLKAQCETVFGRIAETQRRNVRIGTPISLGAGSATCMDMRTLVEV